MKTKKFYEKPSLQIAMLQYSDLIATSGGDDDMSTVLLDLNLIDLPEPFGFAD